MGKKENGRLSNVELAEKIGLSESACLRRVKRLEAQGVIGGYAALVDQRKLGLRGNVFVRVSLEGQQRAKLAEFEGAVLGVPEVMECYLRSGDSDYLLRVVVGAAEDYERLHNVLTELPGVARVHSSFALREVMKKTGFEL